MTVKRIHLLYALFALGAILILYGLAKLLFKVNLGPAVEDNLPTVVMVGAAGIFVWNRSLWAKEKKQRDEEEEKKQSEDPPVDPPAGE